MRTRSLAERPGERFGVEEATRRGAELLRAGLHLEGAIEGEGDEAPVLTLRDLLSAWLGAQEERADLRAKSLEIYRRDCRRVADLAGDQRLATIGPREVERLRDGLAKAWATNTARSALSCLQAAWRWGLPLRLVPGPLPGSTRLREAPSERYTPPVEDLQAVVELATGRVRVALAIAWSTGARLGEISGADWADVDLTRGTIRLCGKTGPRTIPLVGAGLREAKAFPFEDRVGRIVARETLVRNLASLCERAGVRPFSIHGIRRLTVDTLLRSGVDIATAASITGHTPQVMLAYYRQATADDRVEAMAVAGLGEVQRPGRGSR